MALLMLGYRCCSDFDSIPKFEFESLLAGRTDRVFDAYVNIGSLQTQISILTQRFPSAKYIVMDDGEKSENRVLSYNCVAASCRLPFNKLTDLCGISFAHSS